MHSFTHSSSFWCADWLTPTFFRFSFLFQLAASLSFFFFGLCNFLFYNYYYKPPYWGEECQMTFNNLYFRYVFNLIYMLNFNPLNPTSYIFIFKIDSKKKSYNFRYNYKSKKLWWWILLWTYTSILLWIYIYAMLKLHLLWLLQRI